MTQTQSPEKEKLKIEEWMLINGLYNLIGAMWERLFNEDAPSITILDAHGNTFNFVPSTYLIKRHEKSLRGSEGQPSEPPIDSA